MDDLFQGYSPDEIRAIAEFERLQERYAGDPEFRRIVCDVPAERPAALVQIGINFDDAEWAPLWQHLADKRRTPLTASDLTRAPLLKRCFEWETAFDQHVTRLVQEWTPAAPRLAAWRKRQIHRFMSEIGVLRGVRLFPLFADELSQGCSIGCWFCGVSAGRLQGVFPYSSENARLWQTILTIGLELAGPACKMSMCYHATEPFDNPDYLRFLRDVQACYGVYPQTTTAAPLKHLPLARELLRLRETCPTMPDRFSVLSLETLRNLHQTFSPYELRYVQLILHNPGALQYKTNCGRARTQPHKLSEANRDAREYNATDEPLNPLTIECLCGYLVNLVERRVKLITPCLATEQWPNGYRVLAETTFRDASEYKAFLEQTMEECMPLTPDWQARLAFRRDLTFTRLADGFCLTSRARRHTLQGKAWHGALGDRIAKGDAARGAIITQLAAEGAPLVEVTSIIQKIFDKGLLADD